MTVAALVRPIVAARVAAAGRVALARWPWRPLRVGVGLDSTSVRAVGVAADGSVRWAVEAQLDDGEPVADALAELLAGAPLGSRGRWPRPEVRVAVGAARAQTKRLSGLPPVTDPSLLAPIVAASVGRFFLRNGVPLVVTGVHAAGPGEAWAAAVEAPVVDAVVRACRAARVRLGAIVPAPALVGLALRGDRHELVDGDVRTEVTTRSGKLTGVRRVVAASSPAALPFDVVPVAPLAALGASASRFADAYGAAVLQPSGEPLAWRPRGRDGGDAAAGAAVPAWRLWTAAGALAASLLAAALAPGLAAHRAAAEARSELAVMGPRARQAAAAEHELARLDAALGEVTAFDAGRRSPTEFLRDLTAALPQGSALLTLRVDSAGGTAVALGPRAAAIVTAIERMPGVSAPEIVGPVTRETPPIASGAAAQNAPRELERVTVRFRFGGRVSAAARPSATSTPAPPVTP